MAPRYWTCRKCKARWPRAGKRSCEACGTKAPPSRRPKHQLALEVPYERWVEVFGERCGVCVRPPGPNRRLDRDHDHKTGKGRGVLCHRCNKALPSWVTTQWLRKAIDYLDRAERVWLDPVSGERVEHVFVEPSEPVFDNEKEDHV